MYNLELCVYAQNQPGTCTMRMLVAVDSAGMRRLIELPWLDEQNSAVRTDTVSYHTYGLAMRWCTIWGGVAVQTVFYIMTQ